MLIRNFKEKFLHLAQYLQPNSTESLMGLDIGSESLKLLKINTNQTPYLIESYETAPLPVGAIIKEEIKDNAAVSKALMEMIRRSNISTSAVALAIPRSLAIIKNLTIDARLNSEEIESRAWIEANRNFPDLIGEVYLDFMVTNVNLPDPSQRELVLVACRKEQIRPYLEILQNAGLSAQIVDVNCYALERALTIMQPVSPNLSTVALLNLNSTLSSFIVTQNGNLIHAHDQSYDGQRLLNQAKTYLKNKNLTFADNLADDADYQNILKENLISHLRHTMHFFFSSRNNISIQRLVLSGDCANLPNLIPFIAREYNIETVLANSFANMDVSPSINAEEFKLNTPSLALCCGLALSKTEHE